MNTLYIYTSPSNKTYVGVTAQLLRKRIAQHKHSRKPFGKALRKYGKDNFKVRLFKFDAIEEAYEMEKKLVTPRDVFSDWSYNQCEGGIGGHLGGVTSPMLKEKNSKERSRLMKTDWNPMSNSETRIKHKEAVNSKEYRELMSEIKEAAIGKHTSVCGVVYPSVRKAADAIGISPSGLKWRINSDSFPDYYIVKSL